MNASMPVNSGGSSAWVSFSAGWPAATRANLSTAIVTTRSITTAIPTETIAGVESGLSARRT